MVFSGIFLGRLFGGPKGAHAGAAAGAVLAGILFCRRRKLPVWEVADPEFVTVPIALGLGRLGNFINGELFGRPSTTAPYGLMQDLLDRGGSPDDSADVILQAGRACEAQRIAFIRWAISNSKFSFRSPGTLACRINAIRPLP